MFPEKEEPIVKFQTQKVARYLGRSEVPQGLDILVQGQAAGQVVPVSCHHVHQAYWQQGVHILGNGESGPPRVGREGV